MSDKSDTMNDTDPDIDAAADGAQAEPPDPNALTGKERRALRARGQQLSISARIGKDGLTPGALANLDQMFERQDLLKVRMQPREPDTHADWVGRIEAGVGCKHIVKVGFIHLFYRALKKSPV